MPDGKTNADELTKMALLYQAVLQVSEREKKLQLLGKQCRQASFISELAMMFTQFRRSGIPPAIARHLKQTDNWQGKYYQT